MKRFIALAVFAALAVPAVALAGGSTGTAGYGGKGGNVQTALPSHTGHAAGTLPFTGQGLLLPLLVAVFLLTAGSLLLLRARSTDS